MKTREKEETGGKIKVKKEASDKDHNGELMEHEYDYKNEPAR